MSIFHRAPFLSIFFSLLISLANQAFAAPASAKVEALDSEGRKISLAAPARRIVSLSPASTEALFAIGAGDRVVADTSYCDYPVAALALPKIGGFSGDTISIEKIAALKPDLVVSAGALQRSVETSLVRLGIPVFSYDPVGFDGIARDLRSLGTLAGTSSEADLAANAMLSSIAATKKALSGLKTSEIPAVFWETYFDPLLTCGSATFQHAIVVAAGGRDIFSDLPGSWPMVSPEEVIRRAPDFILSADDNGEAMSVAKIAAQPGWSVIPAVKKGQVVLVTANLVSRPTPRVAEGIRLVAHILHPLLVP